MTLALAGPKAPPKILLVGEAWGEAEEDLANVLRRPCPFVGPAGWLLRETLGLVGILPRAPEHYPGVSWLESDWQTHETAGIIARTNVFQLRPNPAGKNSRERNSLLPLLGGKRDYDPEELVLSKPALEPSRFLLRKHLHHLDTLLAEIRRLRPNLVLALGGTATWALLSSKAISKIRGSIALLEVPGLDSPVKILPTYHPSAILQGKQEWKPILFADLRKARAEMDSPLFHRPDRKIHIPEQIADLSDWWAEYGADAATLSVDIETEANNWISEIGIAVSPTNALWLPFLIKVRPEDVASVQSASPSEYHTVLAEAADRYNSQRKAALLPYWQNVADEAVAWVFARRVLQAGKPIVGQNMLYDIQYLMNRAPVPGGITPRRFAHDTMIAQHAMYPGVEKSLAFLASIYTNDVSWKTLRGKSGKADDASE